MTRKIKRHYKKNKSLFINGGQILAIFTLLCGCFNNYLDNQKNKKDLRENVQWIGENLRDKTEKISDIKTKLEGKVNSQSAPTTNKPMTKDKK